MGILEVWASLIIASELSLKQPPWPIPGKDGVNSAPALGTATSGNLQEITSSFADSVFLIHRMGPYRQIVGRWPGDEAPTLFSPFHLGLRTQQMRCRCCQCFPAMFYTLRPCRLVVHNQTGLGLSPSSVAHLLWCHLLASVSLFVKWTVNGTSKCCGAGWNNLMLLLFPIFSILANARQNQ